LPRDIDRTPDQDRGKVAAKFPGEPRPDGFFEAADQIGKRSNAGPAEGMEM